MENKKSVFSSILQQNPQENNNSPDISELKSYLEKIDKKISELEQKIIANEKNEDYSKNINEINKKISEQEERNKIFISSSNETIKELTNFIKSEMTAMKIELHKKTNEISSDKQFEIKDFHKINDFFSKMENYLSIFNEKLNILENEFKKNNDYMIQEIEKYKIEISNKINNIELEIKNFYEKENEKLFDNISETISKFYIKTDTKGKEIIEENKKIELLIEKNNSNISTKLSSIENNLTASKETIALVNNNLIKLSENTAEIMSIVKNIESFNQNLPIDLSDNYSKLKDLLVSESNIIIDKITNSFKDIEDNTLKLYFNSIDNNLKEENIKFKLNEMYEENLKTYNKVKNLISEIKKEKLDNLPGISGELIREKVQGIEKIEELLKSNLEIMESIKHIG